MLAAIVLSQFSEDFFGRRHRLAWVVTLSKIADSRCCDQLLSFTIPRKRDNCVFFFFSFLLIIHEVSRVVLQLHWSEQAKMGEILSVVLYLVVSAR